MPLIGICKPSLPPHLIDFLQFKEAVEALNCLLAHLSGKLQQTSHFTTASKEAVGLLVSKYFLNTNEALLNAASYRNM